IVGSPLVCVRALGIGILRNDYGEEELYRVQFILADAAEEDFLQAGFGIEAPAVAFLHQRHRERPILLADNQGGVVVVLGFDLMLGVIGFDELVALVSVVDCIAG